MTLQLLPCPFCGVTLRVSNSNLGVHPKDSDCLFRQQVVVVDSPAQVSAWNRRATPAVERQEPAAFMTVHPSGMMGLFFPSENIDPSPYDHPLYTSPPAPVAVVLPDVDALAQIIRTADGNHSLGAGALAERIIDKVKEMNK